MTPLVTPHSQQPTQRSIVLLCIGYAILAIALTSLAAGSVATGSLFAMQNGFGPTLKSFAESGRLAECSSGFGTLTDVCFTAHRMPLIVFLSAIFSNISTSLYAYAIVKTVISCIIAAGALYCILMVARPYGQKKFILSALIALATLGNPLLLINFASPQIEEGYLDILFLVAFMMMFLASLKGRLSTAAALALSLAAAGAILTKSSTIYFIAPVSLLFLYLCRKNLAQFLICAAVVLAPIVGWSTYVSHQGGGFAFKTSWDGMNFHKGNHSSFLEIFPTPPDVNIDNYDPVLNQERPFKDEWDFDNYHKTKAIEFIKQHPIEFVTAVAQKTFVFLLSLTRQGGGATFTGAALISLLSTIIIRLLEIIGIWAVVTDWRSGHRRRAAAFFVAAGLYCAPFIMGFPLSRHLMPMTIVLMFYAIFVLLKHDVASTTPKLST